MNQNKSEQAKSTESKRRGNWLKNSIFVRLMIFLGGLEDRVAHSFFISRLAKIRRAFIKRTEIDKKFERPFRLAFSREVEQSALLHLIDRLCERFLATPLRSYGIFLISFAVYYVAIALSKGYLGGETLLNFSVLITGAVVAAVSLPLLLAQKDTTLSKGILQSSICSFFCFDLLGLEKQEFEKERRPVNGFLGGFLGGIVAAIASAFLPVTLILKVAFALIFLRLCYVSPESGMLLSCLMMPFLGDGQTVWLLLSVAFFFLVKLLRGKRNVKSGFYVCAFGLYLIIPLFCGIVTSFDNGFGQMVKFLILSLAFFMPALMFYRTEWTKRAARVLTICAILTSVCAVIVYGSAYIPERYLSLLPFVEMLRGRFADYSDFGAFVVALSPMLALRIFTRAGSRGRPLILLAGIFTVFAVVFSRDPGMWICYLLATALFLLFMERNTLLPMIVAALGGSLVYIFLLPGWITGAIEGFSNGFSVNFSEGSDLILQSAKRFFAGVGFGGLEEQGNFYTHILTEQGLMGLLLFFVLLVGILFYGVYSYYKNGGISPEQKLRMGGFGLCLAALLITGVFSDFRVDSKMLFLLFFLAGAVVACGKVLCSDGEKEMRISEVDRDYYYVPDYSSLKKNRKKKKSDKAEDQEVLPPEQQDGAALDFSLGQPSENSAPLVQKEESGEEKTKRQEGGARQ